MKNKLFSIFTALAMVLGILVAPFTSANAADEVTEKLTIHKILMDNESFTDFTEGTTGNDGTEYDGNKIESVEKFFAKKAEEGKTYTAKEIKGAYFVVKNADGTKFIKEDGTETDKEEEALKGTTTATGLELNTSKLKGTYKIYEDQSKSTYKNNEVGENLGKILASTKAVPIEITLPLVNKDGVVKDAHVYPKNTEDKPQIDKNFATTNTAEEVKKDKFDLSTDKGEGKNPVTSPKAGANYDNYQKEKARVTEELGKPVPYEVKTKIPKGSKYKKLVWTDTMTNGLTFNKDLEVKGLVGKEEGKEEKALEEGTDYNIISDERGFELKLTQVGLEKLQRVTDTKDVEVTLTYSAKINKDAVRDMPEKNDIALDYGNKPGSESEPKEGNPSNKEISVEKSWDVNGDNSVTEADKDAKVVYTLQEKDGDKWKEVKSVLVTSKEQFKYTFKELDNNKTYRVIERVSGYEPQYTSFENGVVRIKNKGDKDNPKPLNPTEPEVVSGGKKFVKTDNEGTPKPLKDAIFAVKKGKQYLAYKSNATSEDDKVNLATAKKAYTDAIDAFNKLSKTAQEGEEGEKALEKINSTKDAYFKAFKADDNKYEWVDDINDAIHLQSNAKGQIEINGLAYGDYALEEVKAPAGYAKLQGEISFKVQEGKDAKEDINYETASIADDATKDAIRVKNKKVSIPQTGGIGSLIFVVAGLAIMAGAYAAYRKSQARA